MMDDKGGVTVCITNWNYGRWLGAAIDSVTGQTVSARDWYVVDDASSDPESLVIYSTIPDRVHRVEVQRGAVSSYNRGLELCKTEWIIYLDADDELALTYIEEMLDVAYRLNVPWVYCDATRTDEDGRSIGVIRYRPFCPEQLKRGNFIHSAAMIKADIIRSVGGWKEHRLEDWDLWKRVAEAGHKAAWIRRPLLRYRKHGPSRMNGGRGL